MTIAKKIEARGFEKGIEKSNEAVANIAKHMLSEGYDLNTIIRLTDLTSKKLMRLIVKMDGIAY